mmetsp:Transcript_27673/g.54312  ORF Transcript_27673/g.54312 Transcript_27673/m.54312 type:complete len:273 (-) Transcript_27673:53-871(-)
MSPWAGRLTAVTLGLPARKRLFSTSIAAKTSLASCVGVVGPKERARTALGRRTAVTGPVQSQRVHSPILWAPGRGACAADVQALTRAIQARTAHGGSALIGAKGSTSAANALRALARATRAGGNTVEFCVHWEEEGKEKMEQSDASLTKNFALRFRVEFGASWKSFQSVGWDTKPLIVASTTTVASLAEALAVERRKRGRCIMVTVAGYGEAGDTRGSIVAKALASMFRFTTDRRAAWCVATQKPGNILQVHIPGEDTWIGWGPRVGKVHAD